MRKLFLIVLSCFVITGCAKKNLNMACKNNLDCGIGYSCFSTDVWKTECRLQTDKTASNSQQNENKKEAEKPKNEVTPIRSDAKEIEKEYVQISDSGFEKEITFMGLVKTYKTNEGLERFEQAMERAGHKITYPNNYYFIRSWLIKNTGAVIHQLYVSYGYTGADNKYVDWYSANDENTNTLNVVSISKNIAVDSSYSMVPYEFIEIIGVELSNELLKANKNTGFRVKLKSKKSTTSDRVISVTAEQVAATLDAVETKRKEMFPNDKTPNIKNKRGAK